MTGRTLHPALLGTTAAAKAVGVPPGTLREWAGAGVVTPAGRTPSGHARWDVDQLQQQLQHMVTEREYMPLERATRRDCMVREQREALHTATYLGGPLDGQQVRQSGHRWCTYRDGTGARVSMGTGHRVVHRPDIAERTIYALNTGSDLVVRYFWQADPA